MEHTFITAGTVVNTHGIRGEIKLLPQGAEPELLADCKTFYLDGSAYTSTACRIHKGCLLLKLKGVEDMDAALALKGKTASIRRSDVKLPEGTYFDEELIGLAARDAETGEDLGKVEEVLSYPAHKVYVLRGGRDEFLIPAVPAFVAGVDVPGGTINIHVWEGMGSHED